jgi:hypothetical protein
MANSYLALRPRVPISHMAASPRSDSLRRSLPLFEQTLGLEGLEDSEWPSHLALSMHLRKSPNQSPHRFSFCLGPALRSLDRVAATTCLGALPLWCTVARLARTATALLSTTTVSSMNLGWSGAISMSPATVGGRRSRTPTHPVATINSRPRQLRVSTTTPDTGTLHLIQPQTPQRPGVSSELCPDLTRGDGD